MSQAQPRPGSIVTVRSAPPPRTVPTDTGVWFVTGLTDRGPINRPVLIQSLQEFINNFGARQTYSVLYDALETYFREGGARAYVGRVAGPAAAIATRNLLDAGAAVSLVARAKGPGAFGNAITIQVQVPGAGGTAGSFSFLTVDPNYPTGAYTEQSPDFLTQAAAIAWATGQSTLLDLSMGASTNNPVALAASVLGNTTSGTDDRTAVTDAQWRNALALFTRDLGPGQVTQIGRATATAYADTLAHAAANNRFAILDGPDTPTIATITALTTGLRGANARFGMLFAPWLVIPGIVPGTTRIVPPSAAVCGKIAASDASGSTPNSPAAGLGEGTLRSVIGLSQPPYDNGNGQDVTRDAMYSLGVNQVVFRYNTYAPFGWRTLVDPNGVDQDWLNAGNARLAMWIVAQGLRIAEGYILDEIDGRGRTYKAMEGDIKGMLMDLYTRGSLYDGGSGRPEDAFLVDTGPTVNTAASVANRELHAAISARMAQDAELVVIEVAKVPVTTAL
jgi:phage tail sheath protein FI